VSGGKEQSHVVAVIGSPRRQGNTAALVGAALEELERSGCRCTTITLADLRIDACDGHRNCGELAECPLNDDMADVLEKVYAADGLILASPVYYSGVAGTMSVPSGITCASVHASTATLPAGNRTSIATS